MIQKKKDSDVSRECAAAINSRTERGQGEMTIGTIVWRRFVVVVRLVL